VVPARELTSALQTSKLGALGATHIKVRANVLGLLEAFTSLEQPVERFVSLASRVLGTVGERLDRDGRVKSPEEEKKVGKSLREAQYDSRRTGPDGEGEPRILGEQGDVLALWKPAGWTVSVREAEADEADDGDWWTSTGRGARPLQDWVARRLGDRHPINLDSATAYGLLHRLDKNTSGAILCAKSYRGYLAAKVQFATRRVCKRYLCLCHGLLPPGERWLEAPLRFIPDGGRTVATPDGDRAATQVQTVAHLAEVPGVGLLSMVGVELRTGRQHQIRAHLSEEGHPLVADERYGGWVPPWCERVFLHAHRLSIDIGAGEGPLLTCSPLPVDLQEALPRPTAVDAAARALRTRWLQPPGAA